jgi:glycosyltransferase involved in cell wall biosynthesis
MDSSADAVVPSRFLGRSSWPLPIGGLRTLWKEVSAADAVVANNARQLLPVLGVLVARASGRAAFLVVHGSGAGPYTGSSPFGVARRLFEKTLGSLALSLSNPVSVSEAGIEGVRRLYGLQASYLPYPLRELDPVEAPELDENLPLRVTWVGRLFPEKDPLTSVGALDILQRRRNAVLDVFGDGPLRAQLDALTRERPWLHVLGARSWEEVQRRQADSHVCLSTSVADNVQVAVLEALSRGIPTVSTQVGDAPTYYASSLEHLCVRPEEPQATADALLDVASSYDAYRGEFDANGAALRQRHGEAGDLLARLVSDALPARPQRRVRVT